MVEDLIDQLRDQISLLRERNRQLENMLAPDTVVAPLEWGLTASEQRVFAHLTTRDVCTKASLVTALYSTRVDVEPGPKIVDVFVCKMRKKLTPHGVQIETVWGQGYSLVDRTSYSAGEGSVLWHLNQVAEMLKRGDVQTAAAVIDELRSSARPTPVAAE